MLTDPQTCIIAHWLMAFLNMHCLHVCDSELWRQGMPQHGVMVSFWPVKVSIGMPMLQRLFTNHAALNRLKLLKPLDQVCVACLEAKVQILLLLLLLILIVIAAWDVWTSSLLQKLLQSRLICVIQVWFMFDSCLIFSPSRKLCTKGGGSHSRSLSPSCWKMKKSKSCHNLKTCPCLFWPQAETVRNGATKKGLKRQLLHLLPNFPESAPVLPLLSSLHQPLQLDPCNHRSRLSTVFTWLSQ